MADARGTGDGALAEMRVLDLSDSVAGAYCAKLLADSGADVVKVEPPAAGDPARAWNPYPHDDPPGAPGLRFWYLHANKRGITLNPNGEAGRALLCRLIAEHDIIVESYPPAQARARELTYTALGAALPDLIWLSITPFGHAGPYAEYLASDLVIQAASGWMAEGGEPGREPLQTGGGITDYITGAFGAVAATAAWIARRSGAPGQHIDLSAMEAIQSTGGYSALAQSIGEQRGGRAGQGYPFAIVPCKDGWVGINILTAGHWEGLCAFMGRPELLDDPRFATALARREHGRELTALLAEWAGEHSAWELFQANEWRVPITLLPTVADILESPQHAARGFLIEQQLGDLGVARRPGAPFQMSATPFRLRRSAPALGEHNDEVYRQSLGIGDAEYQRLRAQGVI